MISPALVRAVHGLRANGLCLSCLAGTVQLPVDQTREEMATISEVLKVAFRLEACGHCHEQKTVIRAI